MPVHHGQRWLAETLASAAQQDCRDVEFILLDSSTNDACEIIVNAFDEDLTIRYERMPNVISWTAKTNIAVKRARASYISMLHQDDLWLPNRMDEARASIMAFPDAAILLNPSYIVDDGGRQLGQWRCPLANGRRLATTEVAEPLLVQNFISIPAPIIRRSAWLASGGMDEQLWYTADWDLYLKLVSQGHAAYRETASTAFRVHDSSLTVSGSRDIADFEAQMRIVLDRHLHLASPRRQSQVKRRAMSSIRVNCDLAEAARGNKGAMIRAIREVLLLGPWQTLLYIRQSRILERSLPRLRARLAHRSPREASIERLKATAE